MVIDDTSGLYGEAASMAILKAATWGQDGSRIVRWDTLTTRVTTTEFNFTGKFVIVCNSFPSTPDAEAVKSRSFMRPIHISSADAKRLLCEAAKDPSWYVDTQVATMVADFLADRLSEDNVGKISYRTLEKGADRGR